jgi:hypothetical protein
MTNSGLIRYYARIISQSLEQSLLERLATPDQERTHAIQIRTFSPSILDRRDAMFLKFDNERTNGRLTILKQRPHIFTIAVIY